MGKITMVQYGCGKMSAFTMRYAIERGIKIVGAFDINPKIIGKDISEVMGGKAYGVKVLNAEEFESFLLKVKPDVAIVTTMSLMADVAESLLICAKCGVNAITTCEEALFPANSSPSLFKKIDKLAKANECTICGSGYQDIFWGNLITTLAGGSHSITKIKGRSSYNVEDYGIALAKAHGAGLSLKDFEKEIAASDNITEEERKKLIDSGKFLPSYMWNVNGWLASKLGLTVLSQVQRCVPAIAKEAMKSSTLNMEIPKGYATGMSAVVTTTTKEGIIIESECVGKVYDKTEFDANEWSIIGEPFTSVVINRPATVELTCATCINRIPELLSAPAGFITTEKMAVNSFKIKPLESYVK